MEVERIEHREAERRQQRDAVRQAVPRAQPTKPRLECRVHKTAQNARGQADEEDEPDRATERDLADTIAVRGVDTDDVRPCGESADAHRDPPENAADHETADDARERCDADVTTER